MSAVKLVIDGKEVSAPENMTILEAARQAGIDVYSIFLDSPGEGAYCEGVSDAAAEAVVKLKMWSSASPVPSASVIPVVTVPV